MKSKNLILAGIAIVGFGMIMMGFTAPDGWNVPEKYKTMKNAQAGVSDSDDIGLDLYETHCASCHGAEGFGDGKKGENLDTPMRDFTSEEVQGQADGDLYYKTFIGREEMPNFEKKITDEEERWLLVNYLRTLAE